jgi:hypothetical protein
VGHKAFFHIYGLANQKLLRWPSGKKVSFPIGAAPQLRPSESETRISLSAQPEHSLYARSSEQEIYADTAATTNSLALRRQRRQMNQGSLRSFYNYCSITSSGERENRTRAQKAASSAQIYFLPVYKSTRPPLDGELAGVHTEGEMFLRAECCVLTSDIVRAAPVRSNKKN